jgi:hypothetical protein
MVLLRRRVRSLKDVAIEFGISEADYQESDADGARTVRWRSDTGESTRWERDAARKAPIYCLKAKSTEESRGIWLRREVLHSEHLPLCER